MVPGPVDPATGQQGMSVDPAKALKIAGYMTDNVQLADTLISVANEYDEEKQQEMMEQQAQQQAMVAEQAAQAIAPTGPPKLSPEIQEDMDAAVEEPELSVDELRRKKNLEFETERKNNGR